MHNRNRLSIAIKIALLLPTTITGSALAETQELETVTVVAHERDYLQNTATTAIGLDKPIMEIPASVSVITEDLLKDLQVNNVDEALRNVAGVTKFKTGNGGEEKFSIRGFSTDGSIYKDGAQINNSLNVSNIPSTETANLERIEVLKGPSALLYGEGQPGGIINYVTKRPEKEQYTSVELIKGSNAFNKAEIDTTNAFTPESDFAYRLVGSYEDSKSYQDEVERERVLLNPTVSYSNHTSEIVLGYEYIDDNYTQTRGQILDGNLADGYEYSDRLDPSLFFGLPNFNDKTEAKSERFYANFDHFINESWRIESTYSNTKNQKKYYDVHPFPLVLLGGPFDFSIIGTETTSLFGIPGPAFDNLTALTNARYSNGEGEAEQATLKNYFTLEGPGGITHEILASLTWEAFETTSSSRSSADLYFFNVETEEYLDMFLNPIDKEDINVTLGAASDTEKTQDFEEKGVNILDYITLNDRWSVLVGGRYSEYDDKQSNYSDYNTSSRGGVVFQPAEELSIFASYSEGYVSSGGRRDLNEKPIDPETSVSYELGAKWQPLGDSLLISATLYHVTQEDIAYIVNPLDAPADQRYGNIGETESKGFEFEVVGYINDFWRVQAGYSRIDNEIKKGAFSSLFPGVPGGYPEGNTLPGIPENSINFTSIYELPVETGTFGFGGSVFYSDEVYASAQNELEFDSWTEVDLLAYYKQDQWKAQFNIRNAFDEEYLLTQTGVDSEPFAAMRVGTSKERSFVASISREF